MQLKVHEHVHLTKKEKTKGHNYQRNQNALRNFLSHMMARTSFFSFKPQQQFNLPMAYFFCFIFKLKRSKSKVNIKLLFLTEQIFKLLCSSALAVPQEEVQQVKTIAY